MFENIFTAKQEKNPEIIKENFESEEEKLVNEAVSFAENIEPEKYKNKSANLLLALSLFIGASTAFAGEQKTDKELPDIGEAQILEKQTKKDTKNQIANFDIKNIITKIENTKTFSGESVGLMKQMGSSFYKDISRAELYKAHIANNQVIAMSENSGDFFRNMNSLRLGNSDMQKIAQLQELGSVLGEAYDYDMLSKLDTVVVSDDNVFQALGDKYFSQGRDIKAGMCGNIHSFLTKTAMSMGIESWIQSGAVVGGEHIWSGMIVGNQDQKQIVFLDYSTVVPTGTLNYKEALGVMERAHKRVSIFNNFVENSDGLLRVKSNATSIIEKASGVLGASKIMEENFNKKGISSKSEIGIDAKISPETKELKINSGMLGMSFFRFDDVNDNPYQSMRGMSALRLGSKWLNSDKSIGAEIEATVLQIDLKDLYGSATEENDFIGRVALEYLDEKQITKSRYGEISANFGATMEGAISATLGRSNFPKAHHLTGATGETAMGFGMIYLDPNETGKFYLRAEEVYSGGVNDLQNQDIIARKTEEKFIVGADVKVFEGELLNIDATRSNFSYGNSTSIRGGITGGKLKISAGYEKVNSDQERILPSTEKTKLELGYNGGPKWRVDVIGAKTKEQYKDAKSNNTYTAEVKLRMFLW